MARSRLVIDHRYALGDTVLLTGLIRDIARAYPDQYDIELLTNWTPVWWNNPHVVHVHRSKVKDGPRPSVAKIGWKNAIKWNSLYRDGPQRTPTHILHWYHRDFTQVTGIKVPCTEPRGELFLTEDEKRPILRGRYWVVMAGGKMDITNKHWRFSRYQEVVNELLKRGIQCVQCGATHQNNVHPPLDNALNMVGRTDNVRDFFNLVMHAEGVISPVTGAMHVAAVFDKPCVVIAGGREEPWFEWYGNGFGAFGDACEPVKVPHRFLHTLGQLHCCDKQGCWKRKTVPLIPEDLTRNVRDLCKEPVREGDQTVALCMHRIQVGHVVEAVMSYYDENILPPIGPLKPVEAEQEVQEDAPPPISIPTVDVVPGPPLKVLRQPAAPVKMQPEHQKHPPTEYGRKGVKMKQPELLDNPVIGGKLTVFVLCYGPHPELAKRCLDSILTSVPRDRIDLRVATNAADPKTVEYVRSLNPDRLYVNQENRKKYVVMREMFHDPQAPIRTKYVVWFDDDAYAVDPRWVTRLAESIIANHKHGCRLYGMKMFHDLRIYKKGDHNPRKWFEKADWFKGVHLRVRGQERFAPNGSAIDFVAGWFWALDSGVIKQGNIPDPRLSHNGGDITIGEQVHQCGFKIKDFNKGKVFIFTPPKKQGGRRGFSEAFPWADDATKKAHVSGQ